MKIIVSHDVDHFGWSEHFIKDFFVQKWFLKNCLHFFSGGVDKQLFFARMAAITHDRLHNVPEVIAFDRSHGVPSTFFVGVANGLSMSYSISNARNLVDIIKSEGFEAGVHGISFAKSGGIQTEYQRFQELLPCHEKFGIRNHYLRRNEDTLKFQAHAGYLFDSSEYGLKEPYQSHGIWEFPVSMMDSYLLPNHERGDCFSIKKKTLEIIGKAEKQNLPFFTLIFHDVYFSELFPIHKQWYEWIVPWLRERFEFSNFPSAIKLLEYNSHL